MHKLFSRSIVCVLAAIFAVGIAQSAAAESISGDSDCSRGEDCPITLYQDADANAWYHDSVHFCLENNLLTGYDDGQLEPNEYITCGMAAMILYRIEGSPELVGDTVVYEDSPEWCREAMLWAYSAGVLTQEDSISPEDTATWSLLQAMVSRYGVYKGYPMEQGAKEVGIADADSVAFARLENDSPVSRAQASELFYRLCVYAENYGKDEETESVQEQEDANPIRLPIIIGIAAVVLIVAACAAIVIQRRRKRIDDTPMVNYNIEDDEL